MVAASPARLPLAALRQGVGHEFAAQNRYGPGRRARWVGLAGSLALHGAGLALALAVLSGGLLQEPLLTVHTIALVSGDTQAGGASAAGQEGAGGAQPAAPAPEEARSVLPPTVPRQADPVELAEKKTRPTPKPARENPAPKPRSQASQPTPAQASAEAQAHQTAAQAAEAQASQPAGGGESSGLEPGRNQAQGHGQGEGIGRGPGRYEGAFGEGDGPRFAKRVLPSYPNQARRLGKEGVVVLRLSLDQAGRLQNVEVVQSAGQLFDEEAVQALKASSYHPAMQQGRAVPCAATIRIRFSLTS